MIRLDAHEKLLRELLPRRRAIDEAGPLPAKGEVVVISPADFMDLIAEAMLSMRIQRSPHDPVYVCGFRVEPQGGLPFPCPPPSLLDRHLAEAAGAR